MKNNLVLESSFFQHDDLMQQENDRDRPDIYAPSEETRLLPKNSTLLVGFAPNLEEMVTELERRNADHAITEKASSGFDV
jgi:hypothetical protein